MKPSMVRNVEEQIGYDKGLEDAFTHIMEYCDWWINLYESSEHSALDFGMALPYVVIRNEAMKALIKYSKQKERIERDYISQLRRQHRREPGTSI